MHLTQFWAQDDNPTVIKTDMLRGTYRAAGVKDDLQLRESTRGVCMVMKCGTCMVCLWLKMSCAGAKEGPWPVMSLLKCYLWMSGHLSTNLKANLNGKGRGLEAGCPACLDSKCVEAERARVRAHMGEVKR